MMVENIIPLNCYKASSQYKCQWERKNCSPVWPKTVWSNMNLTNCNSTFQCKPSTPVINTILSYSSFYTSKLHNAIDVTDSKPMTQNNYTKDTRFNVFKPGSSNHFK